MNHTPQIKKAIQFAARKHRDHTRLGRARTPYISHLFSVALLVAEDGADDDTVTAALLHDVLEDTPTERSEVAALFGERVATLIECVSENKELSWDERHRSYLAQVEAAPDEALRIAIADKIDNIEDKLDTLEQEGTEFLAHFTNKSPEAYIAFNAAMLAIARGRLPEDRLTRRLGEAHGREKTAFSVQ